ncbi:MULTISPECIES: DUF6893 family small protein [unclassified Streptomyces]
MIKTLVGGVVAAALAAVLVQSLPDIRRYLRMRSM